MEIACLRVVTNHLPIFGVPLALALLLLGLWTREPSVQRAAIERHEAPATWAFAAVLLLASAGSVAAMEERT